MRVLEYGPDLLAKERQMADGHSPRQNRLLAALPATDYWRLTPYLERVQMPYGAIIHDSAHPLHHLYFPTSAIASLQYVMVDGASSEITGIGNEGMVGIAVFTGGETMPGHVKVLFGGHAYRVPSRVVRQELHRPAGGSGGLYHILLRYTQARLTQIAQIVACNRHHSIEQRLSRWLLSSLDRSVSTELTVTQEAIAGALGVRRESITATVGRLQQAGFIHSHRGHIRVLQRAGLETHACECYQVVKEEIDRLLPDAAATQATAPHYGSIRHTHRRAG
jgi:DNA-binding IscR family transcriptional regulator